MRPTVHPVQRPTPPTYAGVVKDQRQGQAEHAGHSGAAGPYGQDRATTPRVYNIPIAVEPGYTTSTEASRWYDKLFGKSVDADDSPWGRRRRQVDVSAVNPEPRGEQRSEVVIGSNAIRVAGARPSARPSAQSSRRSSRPSKDTA